MKEAQPAALNDRIARRVRDLRAARGLSLDALAAHCGVSRSMISLIERGESSPTAVVLEKLATGLACRSLRSSTARSRPAARWRGAPTSRSWRDPHSGYVRRNVSPAGLRLADPDRRGLLPARGARGLRNRRARARIHQQVWVLEGTIEVTVGDERHRLGEGDCLAMHAGPAHAYRNPTRKAAR